MVLSDSDQSHLAHGRSHDNPYLFYDDLAIMCVQSVSKPIQCGDNYCDDDDYE